MVGVGIRNVYGIVGDSANPIVDAMRRHTADINFVHVRNEEAGAFAAGADAQVSGRPDRRARILRARAACTCSTGSTTASETARPCSRSRPTSPAPRSAPATSRRRDPSGIFAGCCNYVATISSPEQMPRLSQLALQAAILERGVGMVILPGDVAAAEVDQAAARARRRHRAPADPPDRRGARRGRSDRSTARSGSRSTAARGRARRATRSCSSRQMLKAPVAYAYRGKDVLEHDNPAAVGMIGLLGWGAATEALGDVRPAAHAGHRLPVSRVPPRRSKDHPGRRPAARTSGAGRTSTSASSATSARRCARCCRGSSRTDRTRRSSTAITEHHAKAVEGPADLRRPQGLGRGPAAGDGRRRALASWPSRTPSSPSTPACATSGAPAT